MLACGMRCVITSARASRKKTGDFDCTPVGNRFSVGEDDLGHAKVIARERSCRKCCNRALVFTVCIVCRTEGKKESYACVDADIFLDDMTVPQLEEALGTTAEFYSCDGYDLLSGILKEV